MLDIHTTLTDVRTTVSPLIVGKGLEGGGGWWVVMEKAEFVRERDVIERELEMNLGLLRGFQEIHYIMD